MVDVLGAVLSAFLQVLFDRIARREVIEFFRSNHLEEALLEKLKMNLLSVTAVLSDAEEKQFIDPFVRQWVDNLKDAAYEAEYLLDMIDTKALKDKMKKNSVSQTIFGQVRDYTSSLNPFGQRVEVLVNKIIVRLKSLIEHKHHLGLTEGVVEKPFSLSIPTTSLVDEHKVYGRDGDKEKIVQFLLSGDANGGGVPVLAIVGMAGLGKTTLAQILYNDPRVANYFHVKSWVYVSAGSNVYQTTKKIYESITFCHSNITDLNLLQLQLKHRMTRQRFLLVLDDFWNENSLDWDILKRPFESGDSGSRIIVTTRSQSVSFAIRADLSHFPSLLSDEDMWRLFSSHALKSNAEGHPVLREIGQKIVKRCKGLPLAAKTMGSLLYSKEAAVEWTSILNSKIWELPKDKSSILPALRLSYSHLPSHLKRCFTYCSVIPKGCKIEKWKLIYLWMAEGILPQPSTKKRLEDVGVECFQELLSRSFFQQSSLNESSFILHDLFSDLALSVAGEFSYKLEDNNPGKITTNTRHVSYIQSDNDGPERFTSLYECQKLRTFLPFRPSFGQSSITNAFTENLKHLKRLRVLSFSHYVITNVPNAIKKLKHLRYLDLSFTVIKQLPESVGILYNLETLLLSNCYDLTELPSNMSNLINLRHLDISKTKIGQMPAMFGRLKSLQTLTYFVASRAKGLSVAELGELSQLHGSIAILKLENVVNHGDASNAKLNGKKYLHELELKWTDGDSPTRDPQIESTVLNKLEPHRNLERLVIENFSGSKLPGWLGSSLFSSMVLLRLANCRICSSLPSLGHLPSLRELYILKMNSLNEVDPNFYGNIEVPFRSLKILEFLDLPNWVKWSPSNQGGEFASLQTLEINSCGRLVRNLPNDLPSLDKLVISGCQALQNSLPMAPMLREMKLTGYHALNSLTEEMIHGNTLKSLIIIECSSLQLLPPSHSMQRGNCYPVLEHLQLKSCDSLISFPLSFFPKLEDLHLQDCKNLQCIEHAEEGLPCLRKLKIKKCPNLLSFLERGLIAPKLESLSVGKCARLKPSPAWDLERMESLNSLRISGIPSLTSLEQTGVQFLTSLSKLKVKACINLGSLPLMELAPFLSDLTVRECPLLKPLCEEGTGVYWNLISDIPNVDVGN